jgi:ankyrin repeat protein
MHVDLEQARKRAKELVKSGGAAKLADAQREIARSLGYPSWPALVHALEPPSAEHVVASAYDMPDRALELLERAPALREDPWVALTLGDASKIDDAKAPGGPLDAAPLFYVARSRIAGDTVAAARDLLARGAKPNGKTAESWTILSVACSRGDAELVRVLLEAGAEPNDNDSLYHSMEPAEDTCAGLLLEHGALVPGTNSLAHALDYDRIDRVRLLLAHGADPNEGALLAHAVTRRRSSEFMRLLVEHGADPTRRGRNGLTAYQHAVRAGATEVAETLAALGSPTERTAADDALAAIATGAGDVSGLELDDAARDALIELAMRDVATLGRVVDVVGPGFSARWGGGPRGTLLHQASWLGRPDFVSLLLERGADQDERVETEYATPLGWAVVGSRYSPDHPNDSFSSPEADYVAVAKLLVIAGAQLEPKFEEMAAGPLAAWLADRP